MRPALACAHAATAISVPGFAEKAIPRQDACTPVPHHMNSNVSVCCYLAANSILIAATTALKPGKQGSSRGSQVQYLLILHSLAWLFAARRDPS